jgi:hypothetical protein
MCADFSLGTKGSEKAADITFVKQLEVPRMKTRLIAILAVIGFPASLLAAGSAIGMAVANGTLMVNHSQVSGNATLFDGSLVETTGSYSQLQLEKGVQVRLSSESRATVYNGRLVLEAGQSELEAATKYEVEARTLHIRSDQPGTQARIRVGGARTVTVSSIHGAVRVTNAGGTLVARVEAGNTLNFEPQAAGAEAPTRASGCLLAKGGQFILAERTNNVILELTGAGLSEETGNQIEITGKAQPGTTHVPDASQVIKVVGIRQITKGGCSALAKKIGAGIAVGGGTAAVVSGGGVGTAGAAGVAGAAGTAAAAGVGVGTVAVIGGVATAATVGGLAAAGALPGQGSTTPSASR